MRTINRSRPPIRGLRRRGWLLVAPALALIVAACTSAAGAPAYTYPPPASPSGSALAGVDPSASPMAMPTLPAPSVPPSAASGSTAPSSVPGPAASGAPTGTTLHIGAQNIQFDTDHLAAPAGEGWVLEFANNDAGVPHNVEILDATGASVFKGTIVTGPTKVSYQVPPLAAGTYRFLCDVHPTMTGTLMVQ